MLSLRKAAEWAARRKEHGAAPLPGDAEILAAYQKGRMVDVAEVRKRARTKLLREAKPTATATAAGNGRTRTATKRKRKSRAKAKAAAKTPAVDPAPVAEPAPLADAGPGL
jgi:hypothetical protein